MRSFEGVYELRSFTLNEAGCEAPGSSLFETEDERLFVMVGASAFGMNYLSLASCLDMADCATKVQAIRAPSGYTGHYTLTLSEELGADELGGVLASSGFLEGNTCTDREYTGHALTRDGEGISIESRLTPLNDAPAEDGVCWARPAEQRAEAAELPCAELQVLTGVKIGSLP